MTWGAWMPLQLPHWSVSFSLQEAIRRTQGSHQCCQHPKQRQYERQ